MVINGEVHHTEILCKRMSCIVAQTIVRQLDAAREGLNLIGALPHVAEETFDGIGRLNMSMHRLRKRKKGEGMLFVLSQTSHCLGLALVVLGFEASQLSHCFLLCRLAQDAVEFGLHLASFSPGNGVEDIAPLMH